MGKNTISDEYFQVYGCWRHIKRIQAILNHPCPGFILNKKVPGIDQLIKNYVINRIQIELTKLQSEEKIQPNKEYYEVSKFRKDISQRKVIPAYSTLKIDAFSIENASKDIDWLSEQSDPDGV